MKQIVIKVGGTYGLTLCFLNFSEHQNHLVGSFKHSLPSLTPEMLAQEVWGET